MLPETIITNEDSLDTEYTGVENPELHVVRESLDDLFDPEKPETKQFTENAWFLEGESVDQSLVDSLASFYTFLDEDINSSSYDHKIVN